MKNAYLPLLLTIAGGVLYHVGQKSIAPQANPYLSIIAAYGIGILFCLCALWLDRSPIAWHELRRLPHWAIWLVGGGAAMIEIGFLFVYRTGWNLSLTSVIVNICVALLLVPLGVMVFRERLSFQTIIGIMCCLFGLFLLARK